MLMLMMPLVVVLCLSAQIGIRFVRLKETKNSVLDADIKVDLHKGHTSCVRRRRDGRLGRGW